MKRLLYFTLNVLLPILTWGQYSDPNVGKPTSGYGSDGPYTVAQEEFDNPNFTGQNVVVFHPQEITTPVPTVFYSHAYGGNNPNYIYGLTNFVAKKGYALVFVPYQTTGVTVDQRYQNLLEGFRKAARDYPYIIDTTKVGFMGHSFGGGASFGNAYTCFIENNWGSSGRFIYVLAQWYSFHIDQTQIQNFPSGVKLVTEIFETDSTNDHRMAADIFGNISISNSEKDFLVLQQDTVNGYVYNAEHNVPSCLTDFNAFDYYGIYRILDALMDYSWNQNTSAKLVCLGNGDPVQVTMPTGFKPMLQTDQPTVSRPENSFQFPCDTVYNPRQNYCYGTAGLSENKEVVFSIVPNPFQTGFTLIGSEKISVLDITDELGRHVNFSQATPNQIELSAALPQGIYLLYTSGGGMVRLIKE